MLMKTKEERSDILTNATMFMKIKDLHFRTRDVYEKKWTYWIFEGFEVNLVLLIPKDVSNRCRAGAVKRGN
jgi:hypothetical protein